MDPIWFCLSKEIIVYLKRFGCTMFKKNNIKEKKIKVIHSILGIYYRVGISIRSWTCHRISNRKRRGVFIFLGPYNKTLNFHWSMKKHRKVLLTEIMQSTFTNVPTLFFICFLCKVYALSLIYMHKNIYTYIPILPSFPSLSPTALT